MPNKKRHGYFPYLTNTPFQNFRRQTNQNWFWGGRLSKNNKPSVRSQAIKGCEQNRINVRHT